MPSGAPNDQSGMGSDPGAELGFRPVNDLEGILVRCVLSGARATLLRALARSTVCVPVLSERPGQGLFEGGGPAPAAAGEIRLPCVTDSEGKHALVYTSYRQMALAHSLSDEAPWTEVPVASQSRIARPPSCSKHSSRNATSFHARPSMA